MAITETPLPSWAQELRPGQLETAQAIAEDFRRGVKFVVLDGPTGSGKTLVAELVRRELAAKCVYVCSTKTLQSQFVSDFPYARELRGRSNYPTLDFPERFHARGDYRVTAADCDKDDGICSWCEEPSQCPYLVAKGRALAADLAVVNTSYFLAEANYVGGLSETPIPLVVIDECDVLERELMGFVEIHVSKRRMDEFKIDPPEKKTVVESWVEWGKEHAPRLRMIARGLAGRDDPKAEKTAKSLDGLANQMDRLVAEQGVGWVYDPGRDGAIVFKPIRVDRYAGGYLWRHGERFLLMSATVIEPRELADSLGIDEGEYRVHGMRNTYDPERRPIYARPVANMSYKTKAGDMWKLVAGVREVMDQHPHERILVHSVSYDLTIGLRDALKDTGRVVAYTNADNRAVALAAYKERPGSVLIAPSLDRGVDLPYEMCDVVVIAKVPFPALGDKQIAARLYSGGRRGQLWYEVATVRTLVQMMGRGMRAADDKCVCYVLDSQFISNVWKRSKRLIPPYIRAAIKWKEAR